MPNNVIKAQCLAHEDLREGHSYLSTPSARYEMKVSDSSMSWKILHHVKTVYL
jgi:hypothetical protein